MCQQVQSVSLQTAVLGQVHEFAQNNQSFSVHDITRTLREKTSKGELEIPEVEVSGSSFRFEISHKKVKALFDELYRTGVFDPDITFSRTFNGMYFDYAPTLVSSVGQYNPTPAPAVTPVVVPPIVTPSVAPVPVAAPVTTTTIPADITARVAQYLTNCVNRNFRPNLKKIQSAIKRGDVSTGVSCETLKALVQSMGYTVVDDPDALSNAQVITV
jgi:hypothetical protein